MFADFHTRAGFDHTIDPSPAEALENRSPLR